jgi:hypothetical protein
LLKTLAFRPEKPSFLPFTQVNGLVAQLEERLNGIEEVVSSNLIGSTISQPAVNHRVVFIKATTTGHSIEVNGETVCDY